MSDGCPWCGSDLRGAPIPEAALLKGYYGEWNGEPRFYSRMIGIEIRGEYDGVSRWHCPDCGATWDRWTGELVEDAE